MAKKILCAPGIHVAIPLIICRIMLRTSRVEGKGQSIMRHLNLAKALLTHTKVTIKTKLVLLAHVANNFSKRCRIFIDKSSKPLLDHNYAEQSVSKMVGVCFHPAKKAIHDIYIEQPSFSGPFP